MGLCGTGCKVLEKCRGMKENTRGTYVRGAKCQEKGEECRECQVNMGVGAMC